MPDPVAAPAPATPATAGGRPDVPPVNKPVGSTARGNVPGTASGNADRLAAVRAQMKQVGSDMKDGKFSNTSTPVAPNPASQPRTGTREQDPAPRPTPAVAPTTTPEASAAPPDKAAQAEQAKALMAAKRILVRDHWEQEDFDKFTPEQIIAKAEKRKNVHAETDRVFGEHAALKRAAPQPRAPDGTFDKKEVPAQGDAATQQQQAPTEPTDPEITAMLAAAKDRMGEPAAKLLGDIVTVLSKRMGERAATSEMMSREVLLQQGQAMFAEEYPDVATATPEAFDDVRLNFQALLTSGRYGEGQVRKAWQDALFMAFGPSNPQQKAQRDMLARQSAAQNGSVSPGSQRTPVAPANAMSTRDKLKLAGEIMKANPNLSREEQTRKLNEAMGVR